MNQFPSKEYELIRRLQNILPPVKQHPPSPYETAIGDDAAVRAGAAGERLIVTADVSVENVHFSLDTMTLEEAGYRAMVSNLSDCAAMGARPDGAVVQIVFPPSGRLGVEEIYAGFARACARWDFPIVGGDLSGGGAWTIGITLIGSVPPNSRAVKRQGIVDGDVLWVTGMPGLSAAGLACLREWGRGGVPEKYQQLVDAHISPAPRISEGINFASCKSVHAMMDLSDGLSKDIATLGYDNNLGFMFDAVSRSDVLDTMIGLADELQCDWRGWYYHGGEEYELLVACDPPYIPPDCIRLGQFTSKRYGLFFVDEDGLTKELPLRGWDHCG